MANINLAKRVTMNEQAIATVLIWLVRERERERNPVRRAAGELIPSFLVRPGVTVIFRSFPPARLAADADEGLDMIPTISEDIEMKGKGIHIPRIEKNADFKTNTNNEPFCTTHRGCGPRRVAIKIFFRDMVVRDTKYGRRCSGRL